nr:Transcription factor YY2 [Ipomoea batatas]GMD30302.1 Transcription factor YY2 [Ipomoea batatas]
MEAQKFHNLFDRRPIAKSRAPATKWFKEWKKGFRVQRRKEWGLQSLRLRRLLPDVLRGCMRPAISSASLFRSTTNWWSLCLKGRTKKTARTAILKLSTLFLYSNSSTKQTCGHGVDERAETGKLRTRLGIDESREATMVA